MKYLNSFNSVGALNNFYKGKDYKEPNVNIIKTSENEDPIIDMNSEYDIICFFDTTENLNDKYLITDYDKTSLESIIVDGNRYRVKDLPLNKSDLEPGEHIIKLKYKNKTIFGNLNNSPVFSNNYLKKVIIPKGIENIYTNACSGCTSLTNIVIPDSVTSIGNYAFGGCSLESIYINFNEFNNYPLGYLGLNTSKLKSVTLGDRINNIYSGAFNYCSLLTSITIPDSVTSIGTGAFSGCTGLTSITIPDSVTSIGDSAFTGCSSLTSITIPDSVTSIGASAFYGTKITNINIGNNLTSIGYSAFYLNSDIRPNVYFDNSTINNLENIMSPSIIKNLEIGQHAITQNGELCLTTFSGFGNMESITFPEGLTVLPNLYGSSSLKTFNIPSTVITINDNYLYGCNSLEDSYVEDGIRYIDIDNFCTYIIDVIDLTLQHYTIKNGVKGLPFTFNSSFTNIQSITLPNSLTNIADGAFDYLYENNILTSQQIDFILNINPNAISKIIKLMQNPASYFEDKYFTICALENGTLNYTFFDDAVDENSNNYKILEYSKDNGETWLSIDNIAETLSNSYSPTKTISVLKNDIILFRSTIIPQTTEYLGRAYGIGNIKANFKYYVAGNIMSLLYGDNFIGQTSLNGKNYAFKELFSINQYNDYQIYQKLIRADKLILPATTLSTECYKKMFYKCSNLTTTPTLPATTLASNCYESMFSYCSSLTTAPSLPATILASYCYYYMFRGCTSLNSITMLATNISASNCLTSWVNSVASTGTLIKDTSMTTLPTGNNGIPEGWTMQDYVAS